MGGALHTRHYIAPHRCQEDPSAGTVPAGYRPVTIAGIPCYSNQQPPTGTSLYSDGSLQTVEIAGSEYRAAGAAVTKGPLPSSPGWRAHSTPTGLKCTEQPLAQPSHPTVTLNISTTWLSQNALTADPRTNVPTPTSATKCATRCNINALLRSGSPATALRRRPATRRDAQRATRTNSAQCGSRRARQDGHAPTHARLRSPAPRRYCDMRRAHPHSGAEMDPPAEACCHFRRCELGVLAADARGPTHALG